MRLFDYDCLLILNLRKPLFAVLSKSITISRGDGIPPNLARNLEILRRVGTLPVVLGKSITISRGNGIPPNLAQNLEILRRGRTFPAVLSIFIKYQVAATAFLPI